MFPNAVSGSTPTVYFLKVSLIKYTWFNPFSLLAEDNKMDGSDKRDIQNVYYWCVSRNKVGKQSSSDFTLKQLPHPSLTQ